MKSKLLIENSNLTEQTVQKGPAYQTKGPNNLLKEFQGCIKDKESYPMIELTCTEYGKFFFPGKRPNFTRIPFEPPSFRERERFSLSLSERLSVATRRDDRFCCSVRPQTFRLRKPESPEANSGRCGVSARRLAVPRGPPRRTRTDLLLRRSAHRGSMGSHRVSLRRKVSKSRSCDQVRAVEPPYPFTKFYFNRLNAENLAFDRSRKFENFNS